MNPKACWNVVAVILFMGLSACSSGGGKKTETLTPTSGGGQSATVGTAFAAPLVATVMTGTTPTSGAMVTFTAPGSGASGTFANGTATETDMTNSSGVATSSTFTANTVAGAYMVMASATGATAVNYSLTNNAGAAAGLKAASGGGQSTAINTAFAQPLGAQVVDSNGNSVSDSGVVVTYTAPAQTGASATFAGGANTATTNASGLATSAAVSANGIIGGPYTVTASATIGGAMKACNFTLTNLAVTPVITATSGSGQSAMINTAFGAPLVATVTSAGVPMSGVVVTFTPPATGASITFAGGTNTATTDANGKATSAAITANGTAGGPYTVTATAPGATAPANFMLTNTSSTATTENFTFYLSGAETDGYNFLSLAGAVTINMTTGAVSGGVQDYNDGFGITSPQPAGDTITGGQLTVSGTTGQGTLKLITNNTHVGVSGTETLGVQFVNTKHALVIQFDGTATSSGSMDLQVLPNPVTTPSGAFAYIYSGVDSDYNPAAAGGVFSIDGSNLSGTLDLNDAGETSTGNSLMGTVGAPNAFGRGKITGTSIAITINYYIVGPEAIRIIDVDADDTGAGSAFGQGSGTFNNASLGSSVLALAGNSFSGGSAEGGVDALGQFSTTNTSSSPADFSGTADDNEFGNGVAPIDAAAIAGTYSFSNTKNGYGSLTISPKTLGDVSALGVYLTDPMLNLNDPNNASGGGGALVLDLDDILAGTTGVVTPQTDTSTSVFTGKYAVGMQDFNSFSSDCSFCEFDMVGQGSVNDGSISGGTGLISDPFNTLTSSAVDSGVTFSGTPPPDASNPGRYSTFALGVTIGTASGHFDLVMYQANGGLLYWLEVDDNGVLLGPVEQQGSLTGLPAAKPAGLTTEPKPNQ